MLVVRRETAADGDRETAVARAEREKRVLLTRGSLFPSVRKRLGDMAYCVTAEETQTQVTEVLRAFRIEVCARFGAGTEGERPAMPMPPNLIGPSHGRARSL